MSLIPKLDMEALLHEPLPLDSFTHERLDIFGELILGLDINKKKITPDPPDDDFDVGTVLDTTGARHTGAIPWSVVAGSAGTVDPLAGGNNGYEFRSAESVLAVQVDNAGANVELKMDYTLPDNSSIILAVCPALLFDGSIVNNELQIGLGLNDNDGGPSLGNWAECIVDAHTVGQEVRVVGFDGTTQALDVPKGDPTGESVYLRLARSGTNYYPMYSKGSGVVWTVGSVLAVGAVLDNVWLKVVSSAAFGDPTPIQVFKWIRQGTNNLFPWDVVV